MRSRAEQVIEAAIRRGQRDGADALNSVERAVFLLSELEVDCTKDGIDSFLHRYGGAPLAEVAALLAEAGAKETAAKLAVVAAHWPSCDEQECNAANDAICNVDGYTYETLVAAIERRL